MWLLDQTWLVAAQLGTGSPMQINSKIAWPVQPTKMKAEKKTDYMAIVGMELQ